MKKPEGTVEQVQAVSLWSLHRTRRKVISRQKIFSWCDRRSRKTEGEISCQSDGLHKNTLQNKKCLGRSISERPERINDRSEFGHWEIDTVIGRKTKDDEALLTLTERLTRKEIIRKIPGKNTAAVMQALNTLIT